MDKRIEDRAAAFAAEALKQPAETSAEQSRNVARYMVAFMHFERARAGTPEPELAHTLRRIDDPSTALPLVVQNVGQAFQLLKNGSAGPETSYLSRTMLEDALKLLGRPDLTV
jgi:hypothetical protein